MPTLEGCRSLDECLDRVRAASNAAPPGDWIRLHSARTESWPEARWPSLAELDAASPHNPCVLMSFDHHAAAANSAALSAAGVSPGQRIEPNGIVVVENSAGAGGSIKASGLLLEGAAYAVWGAAPEPTPAARAAHLSAALAHLSKLGFTEVHDLHSQEWLGPALARLDRSGGLPLSVWLYPPAARLEADFASRSAWESPRLRLAGGKVFADGTLNSRTAAMLVDYRSPMPGMPRGQIMADPAALRRHLATSERLGLHLAVHAIGDAAVRFLLDAIEDVARSRPHTLRRAPDQRHRIEHCELIDAADVPRFCTLGVVCSVQPCHLLADIEALNRYLPHRLDRVLPLRELIDSGLLPGRDLWFGSDVPIVRADPADSIQAAVHRRRIDMPQAQAIAWDQRITEAEGRAAFNSI
jgi:predicted amidohydrolase YtcJ